MRIGAAISPTPDGGLAAAEAADAAAQDLGDEGCRLAVVFAGPDHADALTGIAAAVEARLDPEVVIGGVAQGVVGPATEVEGQAGVAVWAVAGAEGEVRPFRSWSQRTADGGVAVVGWPDTTPDDVAVVLADPHSYPMAQVVSHVGGERPGHPVVGGMLTPGSGPGRLLLRAPEESTGAEVHDDGAVGVVLSGMDVDAVVSQGCRPVGEPLVVTGAERNVIAELAGEPATEQLRRILEEVDEEDRALMQRGLQIGLVADEYREHFDTGDFLIRAVMGADPEDGTITIGDVPDLGQVVQFQVRDAASADEDLRSVLKRREGAAGALLFTCNGRGQRFFDEPHHDARAVGEHLTDRVAGAFCAGEIGPVGDRSFLHGFTASLAVFGQRADDRA